MRAVTAPLLLVGVFAATSAQASVMAQLRLHARNVSGAWSLVRQQPSVGRAAHALWSDGKGTGKIALRAARAQPELTAGALELMRLHPGLADRSLSEARRNPALIQHLAGDAPMAREILSLAKEQPHAVTAWLSARPHVAKVLDVASTLVPRRPALVHRAVQLLRREPALLPAALKVIEARPDLAFRALALADHGSPVVEDMLALAGKHPALVGEALGGSSAVLSQLLEAAEREPELLRASLALVKTQGPTLRAALGLAQSTPQLAEDALHLIRTQPATVRQFLAVMARTPRAADVGVALAAAFPSWTQLSSTLLRVSPRVVQQGLLGMAAAFFGGLSR